MLASYYLIKSLAIFLFNIIQTLLFNNINFKRIVNNNHSQLVLYEWLSMI
jgi:hypothetical protein